MPLTLRSALILLLAIFSFFSSCKKVNEATLLGGGLVPEVDNINTFEASLPTVTDNARLVDTGTLAYSDPVALGNISSDPEFGTTNASVYFQMIPSTYGKSPFSGTNKIVDSVVLTLDYKAGYGDTNSLQTVRVYEVNPTTTFNDTTWYKFNQPAFETTGAELGSATFSLKNLHDSMTVVTVANDTVKVASQLRIHLDKQFGQLLANYDSASAYGNDTLFKNKFRGLAIKADEGTGNSLGFFSLSNTAVTQMVVYYRSTDGTKQDTASVVFTHARRVIGNAASKGGQVNVIKRQEGGNWAAYLNNNDQNDNLLYIQSSPGSLGLIEIPALDTFSNKLVHRAELVVTRIPSALDNFFTAPGQLFVDRLQLNTDSAFLFPEFLATSSSGSSDLVFNFGSFGGELRADQTYRFNVTKIVQDIIADRKSNQTFRIYAPFDARPLDPNQSPALPRFVQAIPYPAYGRVVLGGGEYGEAGKELRLRIIYSNL